MVCLHVDTNSVIGRNLAISTKPKSVVLQALVCVCLYHSDSAPLPYPLQVREVSARFLEKLQRRQRESAVVRNISDIILEFVSDRVFLPNSMETVLAAIT